MKHTTEVRKIEIPDAVYESMLRVFIRLALKKQKNKPNRPKKKQVVS